MAKYKHAASPHFDPKVHLKKIGIANQTTMYKKETQAIGKLFEKTMMVKYGPGERRTNFVTSYLSPLTSHHSPPTALPTTRYGPENVKKHFAAFDTICDATQVRQDPNPLILILTLTLTPNP